MINFLIGCAGFYILIQALQVLVELINVIPFHFSGLKRKKESSGVEIPEVTSVKTKYDIAAFKRRIELLKDEDGLYDVEERIPVTDFTGAEIITSDAEMDIDKYTRR